MFPSDVLLPVDYKSFAFIDDKQSFNSHWDITWSFTFALTGQEHAICTFLTSSASILSAIPGNYYNILGTIGYESEYLLTEDNDLILTEDGNPIIIENDPSVSQFFSIAFDSTGYYSLSNTATNEKGLGVIPNSLVIRDFDNVVIYNEALSSLSTEFFLTSAIPNYQTVRLRYANAGNKLVIDFRKTDDTEYINLINISLSTVDINDNTILYPGFSFCSPISSNTADPSTLYLQNFHVQGNMNIPTYE